MKRAKQKEESYEIVSNWKPAQLRTQPSSMKRVFTVIERLQKGQSFFVPAHDCKFNTINYYISKEKDAYRTNSFYISLHAVRDANGTELGTQVYRAL